MGQAAHEPTTPPLFPLPLKKTHCDALHNKAVLKFWKTNRLCTLLEKKKQKTNPPKTARNKNIWSIQ